MTVNFYRCLLGITISLILFHPVAAQDNETVTNPDVRLVIDVSGSMKQNDPNNLRQPAVGLLLKLLPDDSKAGIWTFGKWVNLLVPHQSVTSDWRRSAEQSAQEIQSVGLYTNIGEALEKAGYDIDAPDPAYHTSLILLTDGMVDIDKNAESNQREWRRIVDEILPKLKQAGYRIHTIALSNNADQNLLNKLSVATDGIAEVALTADDLMKVFLRTFDASAPAEQLPMEGNSFVVDSSVEEFTALIFRDEQNGSTQLVAPDEEVYEHNTQDQDISWYTERNYDLITVRRPLEGEWWIRSAQGASAIDPESRVTIVSNLNLRVIPMPNNIAKGHGQTLTLQLQEDGKTITRAPFLALMSIKVELLHSSQSRSTVANWTHSVANDPPPANGIYHIKLPRFEHEGLFDLSINVDGKSFARNYEHRFIVQQPFTAQIDREIFNNQLETVLTVATTDSDVDVIKTQIVATVIGPDRRKVILPLKLTPVDSWKVVLQPQREGNYTVHVTIKGQAKNGAPITTDIEDLSFTYSLDQGIVGVTGDNPEMTGQQSVSTQPSPENSTGDAEAVAEPESDMAENNSPPAQDGGFPTWLLYCLVGIGNLAVFGLAFAGYRIIMASGEEKDIEAALDSVATSQTKADSQSEQEQSEEKSHQEAAAFPAMDDSMGDDIEPPMDDLDTAMDDLADLTENKVTQNTEDLQSDDAPNFDQDSTDDMGFDDLDTMALEQTDEASADTEESLAQQAEKLKRDLVADADLDEAISNLMNNLEEEENK